MSRDAWCVSGDHNPCAVLPVAPVTSSPGLWEFNSKSTSQQVDKGVEWSLSVYVYLQLCYDTDSLNSHDQARYV